MTRTVTSASMLSRDCRVRLAEYKERGTIASGEADKILLRKFFKLLVSQPANGSVKCFDDRTVERAGFFRGTCVESAYIKLNGGTAQG